MLLRSEPRVQKGRRLKLIKKQRTMDMIEGANHENECVRCVHKSLYRMVSEKEYFSKKCILLCDNLLL